MRVRLVQMEVGTEIEENMERAIKGANFEQTHDIDVIVFPEMFLSGFSNLEDHTRSLRLDDEKITQFQHFAQQSKTNLILGSLYLENASSDANHYTNTTLIINRKGKIISRYDKMNLFLPMLEDKVLQPGKAMHFFSLDAVRGSSIICYDLRFPELSVKLQKEKDQPPIDILFIPAQWPQVRESVYETLVSARAIENQCVVVFVNSLGGSEFRGNSLVADSEGEIIFRAPKKMGAFDIDINFEKSKEVRNKVSLLKDRLEM